MPDAAADADKERSPDTTPASDEKSGDAGPAAAETTPKEGGGVGDMALQKKAEVGGADDPMEKEADAVAQRIMRATEAPKPMEGGGPPGPVPTPKPGSVASEGAEPVRRKTDPAGDPSGADGGELPDSVRDYLANSKGGGSPLPEATRKSFESKFEGADFGAVRVHDEPGANEAARLIGAVAFTRGADIYFAAGMYDPISDAGQTILAHELTHVVQQGGAGKAPPPAMGGGEGAAGEGGEGAVTPDTPNVVRRKGKKKDEAAGNKAPNASVAAGTIDLDKKELHLKQILIPSYKRKWHPDPLEVNPEPAEKPGEKKDPKRRIRTWEDAVGAETKAPIENRIAQLKRGAGKHQKGPVYYVQFGTGKKRYLIGDVDTIAATARRPMWNPNGHVTPYDVDHKKERQFKGEDHIDNYWLLVSSVNRSIGPKIDKDIEAGIKAVVEQARPTLNRRPPAPKTIRYSKEWKVTGTPKGYGSQAYPPHWTLEDVKSDKVAKPLQSPTKDEVDDLRGTKDKVSIYKYAFGGAVKHVDPDKPNWGKKGAFKVSKVTATPGGGGSMELTLYPEHKRVKGTTSSPPVPLKPIPGVEYGGVPEMKHVTKGLVFQGLSPLEFQEAAFDPDNGLVAAAKIPTPSLSILKNTEVGVRLDGADVAAYARLTADGIQLPGPLQVTSGALEVSVGTQGFEVEGELDFEVEKIGRGSLKGTSNKEGLGLTAKLEVDSELFTTAEVRVHYKDGKWGGGGTLGVGPDTVKGIKKADVNVDISEEKIEAKGSFETSLKGLEKGTLNVLYEKDKGLEVSGQLTLGKLPGIEGGTIDAKVKEGAEGYTVSGGVTAKPSIPGVTGSVTGRYEDGAFLADADLGYSKGMLSGKVRLGVTNQAVTGGKPAGPPTDKLTTWGGGQVTIKIAPWLQGTIGLELDATGKLTVRGEVALPDQLKIFEEKKVEKNIFSIGVDIPIVGVSVLGQNIGIFASIGGGLDASAGFGPGVLRGVKLVVQYSPDDEGATKVTGSAEVHVPARAGLTLFVEGALGAGIPVVSAKVGLKVSGGLGLEGAATASVTVDWTPSKGLVLDAKGEIFVEPKFRFAIAGFARIKADLFIKTITLYKQEWNLAAVEYGSNLRFGVKFPVHYEEGKEFDLSLNNVEFVYPSIDAKSVLKGLVAQVA